MRVRRILLAAWVLCVGARVAAAQGQLLQKACINADAVVLGTIEPVLPLSSPGLFTISVDRAIKGQFSPTSIVSVSWPGSAETARMSPSHYRALWFLRRGGPAGWEISPIGGTTAPIYASGLAVPAVGSDGTIQSQTTNCYAAVWEVLKQDAAYIEQSPAYMTAIETLLRDDPAIAGRLLPDFASTVRSFVQSPSSPLKALALASLIRGQDALGLAEVAAQGAMLAKTPASAEIGLALAGWRGSDRAALAALGTISQFKGADHLSRPAAQALMMIHTKDAVPYLANLLSAGDLYLQDAAIRGLSLFVRGAPVISAINLPSMSYLTEALENGIEGDAIYPYVTITPVPAPQASEYVRAWMAWWNKRADGWK